MQPLINLDLRLCGRNLLFEHLEQMILLLLVMNPTITGSQREHLTAISIPAIVPANMAMPNVQSTSPNLATCAVRLFYRKIICALAGIGAGAAGFLTQRHIDQFFFYTKTPLEILFFLLIVGGLMAEAGSWLKSRSDSLKGSTK